MRIPIPALLTRRINAYTYSIPAILGFMERSHGILVDFYFERAIEAIIKLRNLEELENHYVRTDPRNTVCSGLHMAGPQTELEHSA